MKKHPTRSVLWLTLLATALLAGCDGDYLVDPDDDDGPLRFETLYQNQDSEISGRRELTITNQASWERVWDDIGIGGPPPRVDFDREMVALVAAGTQPDSCHFVEITDVRLDDGILEIDADLIEPGTNCVCSDVVVRPVHAVVFRRVFAPADFDVRRAVENCR
ncbi:MAG TPA: hypothetical protein VLQ45_30370 [Thermoanaerobaculia bacterium]|nr:hypothetical protein [Thermoanaerobaculia bacterium]